MASSSSLLADTYLTSILKISNWKELMARDKVDLMYKICESQVQNVPFQNIVLLSRMEDPEEFEVIPSPLSVLKGRGGLCLQINYGLQLLFDSLGYETYLVAGTYAARLISTHCLVMINIDNETYMIDAGSGFTNIEPVCLSKLPMKRVDSGGECFYEYRHIENTTYGRYRIDSKGMENLVYSFDIENRQEPNDFEERYRENYYGNQQFVHLQKLMCFRYLFLERVSHTQEPYSFKCISINGLDVSIGTENEITTMKYKNYKELLPVLEEYFCEIEESDRLTALDWLQKHTSV